MPSYRGGEVDGHQWVWGQEEVVESEGVFELWQHVTVPCDEPGQCEDGAHLRSKRKGKHIKTCKRKQIEERTPKDTKKKDCLTRLNGGFFILI